MVVNTRPLRVLVVDNDPVVRMAIDRQLDALGWEAVPVDSGEDAIHIVELGFVVDVLLTDLHHSDGIAVAAAIAGISPATRVAFMSGSAPRKPLQPRDAPFLLKPFTTNELANALTGAIPMNPGDRPRIV